MRQEATQCLLTNLVVRCSVHTEGNVLDHSHVPLRVEFRLWSNRLLQPIRTSVFVNHIPALEASRLLPCQATTAIKEIFDLSQIAHIALLVRLDMTRLTMVSLFKFFSDSTGVIHESNAPRRIGWIPRSGEAPRVARETHPCGLG